MENVGGQLGVAGEEGKSREFENDPERRQMDKTMHDLGP